MKAFVVMLAVAVAAAGCEHESRLGVAASADSSTPPVLYTNPLYESPVRGDPGDVLLIAGTNFATGAVVVYQAVADTTAALSSPSTIPTGQSATLGSIAPLSIGTNGLKVQLPVVMTAGQSYALWVANIDVSGAPHWSSKVLINDARPMWLSPSPTLADPVTGVAYPWVYKTATRPGLTRDLKIVGRNLQAAPGKTTQVRLTPAGGGSSLPLLTAADDGVPWTATERYVAKVTLPSALPDPTPDPYYLYVDVSRDGTSWVRVPGKLRVKADPAARTQISVTSYASTGYPCTGSGEDDTFCITRAIHAASLVSGGADVVLPAGTWTVARSCAGPGGKITDKYPTPDTPGAVDYDACWFGGGIVLPDGVSLVPASGASPTIETQNAFTQPWLDQVPGSDPGTRQMLLTLYGHNVVRGIRFHDASTATYQGWSAPNADTTLASVTTPGAGQIVVAGDDVTITGNNFDGGYTAVAFSSYHSVPDYPAAGSVNVVVTSNTFGSFYSGLALSGVEEGIIAGNTFLPGGFAGKPPAHDGPVAMGLRGSRHVEISGNTFSGTDPTYSAGFVGFRAGMFFPATMSQENLLIAGNTLNCIGTRPFMDGEAICFDSNKDPIGFVSGQLVTSVQTVGCTVAGQAQTCHQVKVTPAAGEALLAPTAYKGNYLRVDYGTGLGQTRKIVNSAAGTGSEIVFTVWPTFDVAPIVNQSRIITGNQPWQTYLIDNTIDNSCTGTVNASNGYVNNGWGSAGVMQFYGSAADSVMEGNVQTATTGIALFATYAPLYSDSAPPTTLGESSQYFNEIRGNVINGSVGSVGYPLAANHVGSGIYLFSLVGSRTVTGGVSTTSAHDEDYLGFGVSISHNTQRDSVLMSTDISAAYKTGIAISDSGAVGNMSSTPGYVDTLAFSNTIHGIGAPASQGIVNGNTLASDPNYPQGTVLCGNSVDFATPYLDPPGQAIVCGCAGAEPDDVFATGMVGCSKQGGVTWDQRASLCGAGFHPCTAAAWNAYRGTTTPSNDYWTDDNLQYTGTGSGACEAVLSGGTSCGTNRPMRVCTTTGSPAGTDKYGNTCTWTSCGLNTMTNQYFGGCVTNPTAGTLCCADNLGCAAGADVVDIFDDRMVGCNKQGGVTWDQRATLCAAGYHVCSAATWNARRGNAAPSSDYWTDDNLQYTGTGSGACEAVLSGGTSCGTNRPMRVCTTSGSPAGTDKYGNTCTWTSCGYNTMTNQYFGGCVTNTTAGALCCQN
jgi:hypothetical protein